MYSKNYAICIVIIQNQAEFDILEMSIFVDVQNISKLCMERYAVNNNLTYHEKCCFLTSTLATKQRSV